MRHMLPEDEGLRRDRTNILRRLRNLAIILGTNGEASALRVPDGKTLLIINPGSWRRLNI